MISQRNIERLAGILLASCFFLFLGHILLDAVLGPGHASVVSFLFYGFPACLAGLALFLTFREHDPTLALIGGFGITSHGMFVILTAIILLAGLRFPHEFAAFGAESGPMPGIASPLELIMDKLGKSAFALLGIGLTAVGVLILCTNAAARWMGWLGTLVGAMGFFCFFAGLADILVGYAAELLIPLTLLVNFIFLLILGCRLVMYEVGRDSIISRSTPSAM